MAKHTIVLIPGDGIGPEVMSATRRVLEASGLSAEWVELPAGAAAIDQGYDNVLPARTLAAIQAHKLALEGPVTNFVPSSILQSHADTHVYLDPASATELKRPPATASR